MAKPYGILNVNPNGDLLPQAKDSLTRSIGIANDLYGMIGKHYENKFKDAQARNEDLQAQLRQGTLESDIGAKNTKNQTDIQYYPQLQAAELAKQGASIKEIQARTGLSYAEAGAAQARASASYAEAGKYRANTSPIAEDQALYNAYSKAAPGSREQLFYGGILKDRMGKYGQTSGAPMSSGASAVPGTPQGGAVPGGAGDWQKDTKFGSNRMGAGGTYTNPETGEQISTPTNATTSKNQAAIQALQRAAPQITTIANTLPQFQGAAGKSKLVLGTAGNFFGGNSQAPEDYAKGTQAISLGAESLIRGMGLNPTDESLNTMKSAMRPVLGETKDQYNARLRDTLTMLQKDAELAKSAQASGYNVTQPGSSGTPSQQYKDPFYDSPEQKQQVASGFNTNPNVPQQNQQQPQIQESRSVGGNDYVKVNGKWYHK